MKVWVALLRGINVGAAGKGRKSVPMAELRDVAGQLGWSRISTYIQSGNLVFSATGKSAQLEAVLESAIEVHFGFAVPVCVRAASVFTRAAGGGPFDDVVDERPNLVHVGFAKSKITAAMAKSAEPYCKSGERITVAGQLIWADYAGGVGRSKLTPAVLDRAFGSSVTMRNVKTLRAIAEIVERDPG